MNLQLFIVDAHLDLAYNALRGRNVLLTAAEQTPDPDETPSVGLPDLRAGSVGLICATIFCEPSLNGKPGYTTPDEANTAAQAQLTWYEQQRDAGHFRFVTRSSELPEAKQPASPLPAIILLEGADAIRDEHDLARFHARGVVAIGLAWKRTRYAGGTGDPGPLTPAGISLVRAIDKLGIIHDASHLAEESFWNLVELSNGPIMASHSNCRAIVPTDRQLSDSMIRAIAQRDGVIGINFFNKFLQSPPDYEKMPATLADVVHHIQHICDLLGDADHVGLGTDMDGGLGQQHIPREIRTSADLPRVADALASAKFTDAQIAAILAGNWLTFFRRSLART